MQFFDYDKAVKDIEYYEKLNDLMERWEHEVVEFKEAKSNFDTDKIGRYFSAISNEANLRQQQYGWLIFGVSEKDKVKHIVGTAYKKGDRSLLEKFKYEIAAFVAKYAVAMNGIDYIVFTGGIGENQINIRKGICEKLEFMGVKVDVDANNMRGEEKEITTPDSKIKAYVVPTNEELMIAKETARLI